VGYLLDANVFIEAKKRWYGFDFCPGFWAWLDSENKQGKVFSIERSPTRSLPVTTNWSTGYATVAVRCS
jgi:Domain of unknown function (DUF4411)